MIDIIASLLMIIGVLLLSIAAIGLVKLPDLFTQIHAVTKSPTLGIGSFMLGTAVHFQSFTVLAEVLIIIFFITLAAPVVAQLLANAAYKKQEPFYNKSKTDELSDYYQQINKEK